MRRHLHTHSYAPDNKTSFRPVFLDILRGLNEIMLAFTLLFLVSQDQGCHCLLLCFLTQCIVRYESQLQSSALYLSASSTRTQPGLSFVQTKR